MNILGVSFLLLCVQNVFFRIFFSWLDIENYAENQSLNIVVRQICIAYSCCISLSFL